MTALKVSKTTTSAVPARVESAADLVAATAPVVKSGAAGLPSSEAAHHAVYLELLRAYLPVRMFGKD